MIDKLLKRCELKRKFLSAKGAVKPDIVNEVESSLNVVIDGDYKSFLETYGYAVWFGHGICGVSDIDEFSTIYYTPIARAGSLERSESSIVLLPYDAGGYYMLVCEGADKGNVVLVETISKRIVERFPSFAAFVSYLLSVSPE